MTYQVQINTGCKNVSLPGQQKLFNEGDIVELTDDEYNETTPSARSTAFTVLSHTSDSGGGGGITVESDPVASAALTTHKTSSDHDSRNDARYDASGAAAGAISGHVGATDPHGDRAHADTAVSTHVAATDPHGDRAHADTADAAHVSATDPHGDRAHGDTALTTHKTSGDHDTRYDAAGTAGSAVSTHAGAADPHGDRAAATSAITTHAGASDPHGDRAFTTSSITTHASATDPHGDRAFTTSSITTHASATDPHGDRAYTDTQVATRALVPQTGLLAALPATGTGSMRFYWATDSQELYQDQTNGGAYTRIASQVGTELSYDEITSSVAVTSTSFAALPSPGPLSRAVTVGASGIVDIEVGASLVVLSVAASTGGIQITEDGTAIARSQMTMATANGIVAFRISKRRTTTAGSHTYAIQADVSSGTMTIANTGGGPSIFMKITQR